MKKLLFILMSVAAFLGWSTVSAQGTYSKITSASELEDGGVYLIATAEYGMALGMNFGNNTARENVEVSIENGVISTEVATVATDKLPYEIALEKNGENWALYDVVNQKYIALVSDEADKKNQIQNQEESYAWTITIDKDGNADIVGTTGTPSARRILYNSNTGQNRFSAYKAVNTTNKAVQLYKKEGAAVERVERPTFTPEAQVFESTISVTLACNTTGAKIYYSLTDEEPATEYSAPIELTATTIITAIAKKEGLEDSYKVTAKYTLASDLDINTVADLWTKTGYPSNIDGDMEYTVKGKVVVTAKDAFNTRIWVQDMEQENGRSVLVFRAEKYGYNDIKVGDVIENLTGTLENYGGGTLELKPTKTITATENGATPYVIDATIPELMADPVKYQSALVRIEDVTFVETGRFESERGKNYTLVNGTDTITFRTDFQDANYLGGTIPTGAQKITGICATFNNLPQITARNKKDMVSNDTPNIANETGVAVKFSVYPNPTDGMLNVELAEGGQFSLFVYNTNGLQLMRRDGLVDNARVDLSGLAHGMYIVELRTAEGVVRTKVVVR